jgi:hypothetical protein
MVCASQGGNHGLHFWFLKIKSIQFRLEDMSEFSGIHRKHDFSGIMSKLGRFQNFKANNAAAEDLH